MLSQPFGGDGKIVMETEQFPGIDEPTSRDRLAAELADEQLRMIFELRQIRQDRGMSVTEVADAMGVDPAQVSRFESGATNPTMATIRRYAKTVQALIRIDTCPWIDRTECGRDGDRVHWAVSNAGHTALIQLVVNDVVTTHREVPTRAAALWDAAANWAPNVVEIDQLMRGYVKTSPAHHPTAIHVR